jgi:hypothetical protein
MGIGADQEVWEGRKQMANKYMKMYSPSLANKMQSQTTSPQSEWLPSRKQIPTNVGEDSRKEKRSPYTVLAEM